MWRVLQLTVRQPFDMPSRPTICSRQPGLNILHNLLFLFGCTTYIHAYTHSLQIEHLTFGRLLCLPWEVGGEGNSGVFSDSKTSPTSNVLLVLHVFSVFLLTQAGREFVQR